MSNNSKSMWTKIYSGDDEQMLKHNVRRRFYPFNGKTQEEVEIALASPFVSDKTKIFACNFEMIFTDIEKEMPNFYALNYDKQWEVIEKHLAIYIKEIKGDVLDDKRPPERVEEWNRNYQI